MITLLVVQWILATFVTSNAYDTYLYGFIGGACIVLPILVLYHYFKGEAYFRYMIAIAMMLFSVIFIQQYLGRIEFHFHIFIAMAILTLYKDIMPLIIAAFTTIAHHIIFNYLQLYEVDILGMPVMIFNYGCGFDIVILHAIFVLSELFVLGYIIKIQIEQNISLNLTQTQISVLNETLQHSSLHDALTGLPNRVYLEQEITNIKQKMQKKESKFAIVFLDLDHFKNINDTLGHDIGDLLLVSVANILENITQKRHLISRIGGDEFILVFSDFKDTNEFMPIVNKLQQEFREEIFIKGYSLRLSASLGISIYPDDATSVKELMKYADIAMYQAKENGRDNFSFFTPTLNKKVHDEVAIINDMQRAFYEGEFELYLQPTKNLKNGSLAGAEALLRWKHPKHGFISPLQFIPLAESTGFILTLGAFVLEESMKMLQQLALKDEDAFILSINVSTRQFQNTELYNDLKKAIERYDINPRHLGIEITESIMMQYLDKTLYTLNKIKSLGISLYIDDFGTGYSSLAYLKKFPIDVLKIDKSFIDDINETDPQAKMLVTAILSMGKTLDLKIIAEGVETRYQHDYLLEHKCDIIQGYYFQKPMPFTQFLELFQK
jgi:diguanylate cyclase (GGDEF)-like protein